MSDAQRDALLVISWMVGLKTAHPSDADEQWPLALLAAKAYLKQYGADNDNPLCSTQA